ncbi:MAG: DUF481 domain-containing protein [bacterium]
MAAGIIADSWYQVKLRLLRACSYPARMYTRGQSIQCGRFEEGRNTKTAFIGLVLVVFFASALPAPAADDDGVFTTTISAGSTLASGNSEAFQVNGTFVVEGEKRELGSVRTGAEANYGRSTTIEEVKSTTVHNARIFGNVKRTLSEVMFAYLDGQAFNDKVALVDHRITLGPGCGAYLVKNVSTSLSAEVGPAYIWESMDGINKDRWTVRIGERFTRVISESAKTWQSAEYLPDEEDFYKYLVNTEVGIEAALNAHMNLRLVVQDKYDSQPADKLKHNDLTVVAGIGVKL